MRQHYHYEQDAKRSGRHGEKIDSDDGAEMVVCLRLTMWRELFTRAALRPKRRE